MDLASLAGRPLYILQDLEALSTLSLSDAIGRCALSSELQHYLCHLAYIGSLSSCQASRPLCPLEFPQRYLNSPDTSRLPARDANRLILKRFVEKNEFLTNQVQLRRNTRMTPYHRCAYERYKPLSFALFAKSNPSSHDSLRM